MSIRAYFGIPGNYPAPPPTRWWHEVLDVVNVAGPGLALLALLTAFSQ